MVPFARDFSRETGSGSPNNHQTFGIRNKDNMNYHNPSFVPTGPRNHQHNGRAQNNRGNHNHWNNRNNQNDSGYAKSNNWNNHKGPGSSKIHKNWNDRNGSGYANSQDHHNPNRWNTHQVCDDNKKNGGKGNYKGKNFNPNYKGRSSDPNYYKGKSSKPQSDHPVREKVAPARKSNLENQHSNPYHPYPQRHEGYPNNHCNGYQDQNHQALPYKLYNTSQDEDIEMVDAPSDEPNDIEMPDAPPSPIDPRAAALHMSAYAVKEIAETMIKLIENYDASLIPN
ncbi:hypothetical protein N7457_004286 [Penicillium paradoxum]|uniref:uncharacterized protein n=1 Tax=Penicillium paradoxum TaxID=176176 RepID=UPI002546B5F8|nr:uncharacterized protein N7457_004286 [Penicillium paradoxum]KAJ5782512.1 hypothetical protein N7457_004286 [Penicillium paradoxum]